MPCEWKFDDAGYVSLRDLLANPDCPIPVGLSFATATAVIDKHGHPLDGDHDPAAKDGCDHRDTPEWKAEHSAENTPKEAPMSEAKSVLEGSSADVPLAVPSAPAIPTTATVGVDAAVAQVKALVPEGAGPGLLIGGAAVLAVIGAAIKFGPQMMKNRAEAAEREHERELKRLEIEEKKAQQQDDQHGKCATERAMLESKVSAVESSLSNVETKVAQVAQEVRAIGERPMPVAEFDAEEIEERLAKVEKALKPSKPAKKGKK